MRTLGNIIWHVPFLGFLNAFITFLIGGLLTITVVGAPLGLGLIQLSKFLLAPFTHSMVSSSEMNPNQNQYWKTFGIIVRIVYFPFGLLLTVITLFQIVGLFISIVGIPVAMVLAKSLSTFLNPVGKTSVNRAVAEELQRRKASAYVDGKLA
jgi:uncharacterized membrane protein YccF (DUF307 family)